MHRPRIILVIAALICAGLTLFAPERAAAAQSTHALTVPSDSYVLGAGDKVRVNVFDEPDLSRQFEVAGDGTVTLPLGGQVSAAGDTLSGFADKVREALRTYLKNPRVTAEIAEYRPFYIIGEVRTPGTYPYAPSLTVISAVARAGGFTYRAAQGTVFIKRPGEAKERRYRLTDTIAVEAGDTIRIPERWF